MIVAKIREADCIGCAKCLPVCPTDAILGSENFMHTVISDECIGCKLCVPACPVDCIDLLNDATKQRIPPEHVKMRYQHHKARLAAAESVPLQPVTIRKQYIENALLRVKNKLL